MAVLDHDIATIRPTRKEQWLHDGGRNHSDADTEIERVSRVLTVICVILWMIKAGLVHMKVKIYL